MTSITRSDSPERTQNPELVTPSMLGFVELFDVPQHVQILREGHDEARRDAGVSLLQKPLSVLNSLGTMIVKIFELGSYCNWFGTYRFIVPLNAALGGLGIFLCVAELGVGALGLKRAHNFRSQFVHDKPPEQLEDLAKVAKWAAKVERRAQKILRDNPEREAEMHGIIAKTYEVRQVCSARGDVTLRVEQLAQKTLHADLTHLNEVYLTASPEQKEKLLSRLGVGFVENAEQTLKEILFELQGAMDAQSVGKPVPVLEQMQEAERFLGLMHDELDKKSVGHTIAMVSAGLILTGLIIGFTAVCPWWIPVALLLLGSAVSIGHLVYWAGYGNNEGWNFDTSKWFDIQKARLQAVVDAMPSPFRNDELELFVQGSLVNGE